MSDPQPAPGKKTPQRADPLQPDRPGSGRERDDDHNNVGGASGAPSKPVDKAGGQTPTADSPAGA